MKKQLQHKPWLSRDSSWQPRPAVIEGPIAKIPLGLHARDGYATVDANMAWLADKYKWRKDSRGYAITSADKKTRSAPLYLHQLIMGELPPGKLTDHINRDVLDNRLSNLRIVTARENNFNRPKPLRKNATSQYKGVKKRGNRWIGQIAIDRKIIGKGFDTETEAARHYDYLVDIYSNGCGFKNGV